MHSSKRDTAGFSSVRSKVRLDSSVSGSCLDWRASSNIVIGKAFPFQICRCPLSLLNTSWQRILRIDVRHVYDSHV